MSNLNMIRAFLQHASAQGSRSTVLKPIGWMIAICVAATLSAAYAGVAAWITIMFATFCGLTMALYLGSYIYCLANDRDALRSESYTIQKMAIEKGFVGDSMSGAISEDTPQAPLIESTADVLSEVEK